MGARRIALLACVVAAAVAPFVVERRRANADTGTCKQPPERQFDVVGRGDDGPPLPLPRNARVMIVPNAGAGIAPVHFAFELRRASADGGPREVVVAASSKIGLGVVLAPAHDLEPDAAYDLFFAPENATAGGLVTRAATLRTSAARDETAPTFTVTGAPAVHPAAGERVGECDFTSWIDLPVEVHDDSPVVLALWFRHAATIDFTTLPDLYAAPAAGHVRIGAVDLRGADHVGVKAIDVAANASEPRVIAVPALAPPPSLPSVAGASGVPPTARSSGCSKSFSCSCGS